MLLSLILPACLLLTTSCEIRPISIGPTERVETIWAVMGTPGKVVSDTTADVLVEVDGKPKRSKAKIQGMMVLDEPTYNLIWKHWQERGKGDVTPEKKP